MDEYRCDVGNLCAPITKSTPFTAKITQQFREYRVNNNEIALI